MNKKILSILFLTLLSVVLYSCGSGKKTQDSGQALTASKDGAVLSKDISLENLEISEGSLSPSFSSDVYIYDARVPYTTDSIVVTIEKKNLYSVVLVNNQIVSDGASSVTVSLNPGLNVVTVTVRSPENAGEITYIVDIVRGSNVALLSSLALSSGVLNPTFAGTVSGYSVQVDSSVVSVNLTPLPLDQYAEVKVDGNILQFGNSSQNIDLVAGEPRTIDVSVRSSDRTAAMTYSVTVTRALSNNANLETLDVVGGTLSPAFDKNVLIYSVNVPISTVALAVVPTVEDSSATMDIVGSTNPLPSGYSVVNIKVIAQDLGIKTYTLVINRGDSNCALSALNIKDNFNNDVIINPLFSSGTTSFAAQLDVGITSIKLTPISFDPAAFIEVNGEVVASGWQTEDINLFIGVNLITVVVKSSDNSSQRTYSITIVSQGF